MTPSRRSRTTATLIASAIPLGYGPAAKLLILAAAARERGLRFFFVGHGTALELASRHAKLFADIVPAAAPEEVSPALWRSAAGMLSIMDRTFAPRAVEQGLPLFVVDSLLWMRDELPAAWKAAERLWAQNFPGLHDWPGLGAPQIAVVGPIVEPFLPARNEPAGGLLINLGGCSGGHSTEYARFVVQNVLASPLATLFSGRVSILAGEQCLAALQPEFGGVAGLQSASHAAALAHLGQAELVLTAPGLTMTLECFQRGKPTFFLPPQNYSQWCILRSLRKLGLAPAALHWEDLPHVAPLADRLPEEIRNPRVRRALALATADPAAASALHSGCVSICRLDGRELAARQHAFFTSLGASGVEPIVDGLAASLSRARSAPVAAASLGPPPF